MAKTQNAKSPEVLGPELDQPKSTKGALVRQMNDAAVVRKVPNVIDKLLRLSKDPGFDAAKINAVIDAHVRIQEINAKAAWFAAFADLQAKIPVINKSGRIEVRDKNNPERVKRTQPFTTKEDMMAVLQPLMLEHGFAIRFSHKKTGQNSQEVTGHLMHRMGHVETDSFEGPADDSGQKSQIQGVGSTRSFGERYVIRSLFNITSKDDLNGYDPNTARRPDAADDSAPRDERPITHGTKDRPGQTQRLHAIIAASGRSNQEIKEWLFGVYGYTSSKEIKRWQYDDICTVIQNKAALPDTMPGASTRDPGQEG